MAHVRLAQLTPEYPLIGGYVLRTYVLGDLFLKKMDFAGSAWTILALKPPEEIVLVTLAIQLKS